MSGSRDELVFMARTAEACARYEDMAEYMKRVVDNHVDERDQSTLLNVDERQLLASAYKNAITKPRLASKLVKQKLETERYSPDVSAEVQAYNVTVEGKVRKYAQEVLQLIEAKLMPAVDLACSYDPSSTENLGNKVFYHKMHGDYFRYLAEICQEHEMEGVKQAALDAYTAGQQAGRSLPANDMTKLSLTLNLAVFYHEVCRDQQQAVQITTEAIHSVKAVQTGEDPDGVPEILKLLDNNLLLWTGVNSAQFDGTTCEDC